MENQPVDHKKENRFELLKELLLTEDRKEFESLRNEFLKKDDFKNEVKPVLDDKIDDLKNNFPLYFGDQVTQSIK